MIFKIDLYGNLEIQRGNNFVPQFCIYSDKRCGDHCPQFGTPFKFSNADELVICQGKSLFGVLVNERV